MAATKTRKKNISGGLGIVIGGVVGVIVGAIGGAAVMHVKMKDKKAVGPANGGRPRPPIPAPTP